MEVSLVKARGLMQIAKGSRSVEPSCQDEAGNMKGSRLDWFHLVS